MYGPEFEQRVDAIVAKYPYPKAACLPVLWEVQREKGEERGARLVAMAEALRHADKPRLARLVAGFVVRRFPGTQAATAAEEILK